jgi:GcrA cell cycle regulator
MTWDDELIGKIVKLQGDGLSATMIAAELGRDVTRSMVLGKLFRLGLSSGLGLKGPRRNPEVKAQKVRRRRKRRPAERFLAVEPKAEPLALTDDVDDLATPIKQRKTLLELENCHCRWPIGEPRDPGFFYCGAPEADVYAGVPYCRTHTERARGRTIRYSNEEHARRVRQARKNYQARTAA